MASTKITLQEENVLRLVLEFLTSRKFYKSARSVEKETGVLSNAYSENLNFFRDLVLDGDWPAVREFGEPLADVPAFEHRRFNFLVARQEYLEILFEKCEGNIKDEQNLRDRLLSCLQSLERYCTFKEEYNKLYWYLSVPSLRSEPEFCSWSVDSSRMQLFDEMIDLLKQFLPVGDQSLCKNNLASEDRLLSLLFKGLLYENCIEFCQKQAMGKTGPSDYSLTDVNVDLFRKQSLKSSGNFYSWLHSLAKDTFVVPFQELNFDLQVEKRKHSRVNCDVKNNSLSRSLTIELKSPSKVFPLRAREEKRKRLSDFPQSRPTVLDFDLRDVSQSFAEFEIPEVRIARSPNVSQKLISNDVFLMNGEAGSEELGGFSPKVVESPRKLRRDQQDIVLQQLEEHKQRQRELYEQLAETAGLARESGKIKDAKTNDIMADDLATTKSLEAVKKSIQSLKLLTENLESPRVKKTDTKDDAPRQDNSLKLRPREDQQGMTPCRVPRPDAITLPSEVLTKKSSSSTPGSATLPKTPVTPLNTCLPPGLVRLTDGSGAFNTSTPKAERQSYTTPLPASPVTSEQMTSYDRELLQKQSRNLQPEASGRPIVGGQTPKMAISGARQLPVRRSLVNTVFQNENITPDGASEPAKIGTIETGSGYVLGSVTGTASSRAEGKINPVVKAVEVNSSKRTAPQESRFHIATSLTKEQRVLNPSTNSDFKLQLGSALKTESKQTLVTDMSKKPESQATSAASTTGNDLRDFRYQATSNPKNSNLPLTHSAPLDFKKSAMLADSQAIRAAAFHRSGKYFAVGTNSKTLKICRVKKTDSYQDFKRNEQDIPELEVVCQKSSVHKGSVYCVAFSRNGDIIATGSNDKMIKVLKFNENEPLGIKDGMELAIHNATVRDLSFVNTTGTHPVLASGGAGGGLVHLSDCNTGQTVSSLQGHAGNVMALFASAQAHLLCSGSADKTVRLWDLRMAKCIDVISTSSCVTSVCFNFGDTQSLLLASADENGQCIVYDVGARKSVTSFMPHEMDCRSIRFSPDSKYILTGSYDACVAITAVQYNNSREVLSGSRIVARHRDKVIQCRWHPSEYSFVTTSADRTVALWEPMGTW